ncbi:MAG: 6-bladed beta-propeller, partial [Gemmatimonadetes bacterium]|nr:6-bladed beta-propeller [Gemmatimonadota bacterium]
MMRSLLWFGLAATLGLTVAAVAAERPEKEGGYRFSTDLALGGPDASDDASFYEKFGPVALGADAAGRMYVLDNGNARVQIFSPQGKFVATHGSEGDGPGEFRIPSRLAVNAGGEYAVYDLGQGRVSVFGPDGKLRWDLLAPTSVGD